MKEVITVGLDIAKHVFQVHGVDQKGDTVLRRKLRRSEIISFFDHLPPCLIGVEACATAHHWARVLINLGHEVRLMPASYVKPYVKRQKNDASDAEAICEAVTRPTMRFVPVKSEERQSVLIVGFHAELTTGSLLRGNQQHWVVGQQHGSQIVSGYRLAMTRCFEPFADMIAHHHRRQALSALMTGRGVAITDMARLSAIWNGERRSRCCPTENPRPQRPGWSSSRKSKSSQETAAADMHRPLRKPCHMPNRSPTAGISWKTLATPFLTPFASRCGRCAWQLEQQP